eukprot:4644193-Amphidinium_carterae.1
MVDVVIVCRVGCLFVMFTFIVSDMLAGTVVHDTSHCRTRPDVLEDVKVGVDVVILFGVLVLGELLMLDVLIVSDVPAGHATT